MSLISIVIPVYCNAGSLPDLHGALEKLAARNPTHAFEFVFVDDGSRDASFRVLEDLAGADSRIRAVKLSRNFGSNPALMAGIEEARGDAIATIAADFQDPPEVIDEMLECWHRGGRVVLAAREGREDRLPTRLLSSVFYALFCRLAAVNMPPGGFDFFLIDRQVADVLRKIPETNTYLMGLVLWLGFDPQIVHFRRRTREARYGRSMWTLPKKVKYFIDSFVAFSYFPVRLASAIGILLGALGFAYAVVVIVGKLWFGIAVQGFASVMVVLLVASGAQMLMIGVIGEYIWRSLEEARGRPRYVVDRVIGATAQARPGGSARESKVEPRLTWADTQERTESKRRQAGTPR